MLTHFEGLGLAVARHALDRQNKVIIADIALTPEAESLVQGRETEDGASKEISFVKCDVTSWAQMENIIAFSETQYGDVPDVYVASAGIVEKVNHPASSCQSEELPLRPLDHPLQEQFLNADLNHTLLNSTSQRTHSGPTTIRKDTQFSTSTSTR